MKGILIDPGKAPEICRLPDTGQELERWLGGPMQMRKFGHCFAALLYSRQAGAARPNRRGRTGATLTTGTTAGC